MVLEHLEPKLVWAIFENVFTKTPRCSKKEERIRRVLKDFLSHEAGIRNIELSIKEDSAGNILVKKSATAGMDSKPSILLQGHLDMVCETDRKDGFNFDTDPIPVQIQDNGEWVDADETTLGADNGIGMSLAFALLLDPEVAHGPIEVLATVDEETGLTGAFALDPAQMGIESKMLINIDSEDLGVITIGSAGGGDTVFSKSLTKVPSPSDFKFFTLSVDGFLGGHSGVDIHLPRGNANKVAARLLSSLLDEMPILIAEWNGGGKRNAIPRSSSVTFGIHSDNLNKAHEILSAEKNDIESYYLGGEMPIEPDLTINWSKSTASHSFNSEESSKIIRTFHILPHGALKFSPAVAGLVETSNNVAVITTTEEGIRLQMSTRSNLDSELEVKRREIRYIGESYGWEVEQGPAYPGWAPDPTSKFLKFIKEKYEQMLGSTVKVEAIHAGLECGILGAGIPGLKMVSIGPSLKNPHSPDEKLKIADVGILYNLLKEIIRDLPTF
ncbi:MAG: beta-Ala-His dipeptidase [Candidatus Thorarchaeota archaeon]